MKRKHLVAAVVIAALCALCVVPAANAKVVKPAQVKGVAVKATSTTSLKVTWKTVAKAKGYKIRYCKKATMVGARTITVKGAKAKTKLIGGLAKCTRYYVQVRAYKTSKVLGKWSAKSNAKTAHVYVTKVIKPTLTTTGYTTHTCSKCGYSYKSNYTARIVRASVDAYSWAELKQISDMIGACETEDAALEVAKKYNLLTADNDGNYKLTGKETKSITLTDGRVFKAQILGFWHDTKANGGKTGITFGFTESLDIHPMNPEKTNEGGWEKSEMRTWLNDDSEGFCAMLPAALKAQIVAVNKSTNNTGATEGTASSVTTTSDKLWLLSIAECYGTQDMEEPYASEGTQYKLYSDNEVSLSSFDFLIKNYTTSGYDGAYSWWLRSPRYDVEDSFRTVLEDGRFDYSDANSYFGVSPAFCL